MAQGYVYGRPEPAEKTRERLASLGLLSAVDKAAPAALSDVA
jgi:predicted signal transduction protein with EAL and GGDEF domain